MRIGRRIWRKILFSVKCKNIAREFRREIGDGVPKTCLEIKAILLGIGE